MRRVSFSANYKMWGPCALAADFYPRFGVCPYANNTVGRSAIRSSIKRQSTLSVHLVPR
jgi:hypothetical protein